MQLRRLPIVQILARMTIIRKSPAPAVALFSSRGPSSLSPDILKPDITALGINILAAWPPKSPPSHDPADQRSVDWTFLAGTSMSCPHVSGAVALLKSAHPQWSPAAIKSALMTTAQKHDTIKDGIIYRRITKPADPFDFGAGHINPVRAMDLGLVYDMTTSDYIIFFCNIGYSEDIIKRIVILPSPTVTCPTKHPKRNDKLSEYNSNSDLNYPSITVSDLRRTTTVKKTVRNIGRKKTAIYFARIVKPNGVKIAVWARVLFFSCFKEEVSYYVTLIPLKKSQGRYDFGEIVWSDGCYSVRTPLVVLLNTTAVTSANWEDSNFANSTSHRATI